MLVVQPCRTGPSHGRMRAGARPLGTVGPQRAFTNGRLWASTEGFRVCQWAAHTCPDLGRQIVDNVPGVN